MVNGVQDDLSPTFVNTSWLLLLLRDRPSHGYELISRLREVGVTPPERSIYRYLSALEGSGLVASTWETPDAGPARRVFHLTARGEQALAERAERLGNMIEVLSAFLALADAPPPADPRRPGGRPSWRRRQG